MPETISDNRKYIAMSQADADAIMRDIANLEIELELRKSQYQAAIAEMKKKYTAFEEVQSKNIRTLAARLGRYIESHAADFEDPRSRKTDWGEYGIRKVTSLNMEALTDEVAIALLESAGCGEFVKVEKSLLRRDIGAALKAGRDIPGFKNISGEKTFYKTRKDLIDKAVICGELDA